MCETKAKKALIVEQLKKYKFQTDTLNETHMYDPDVTTIEVYLFSVRLAKHFQGSY